MSLGDHAIGRCGASPADALHMVGLFLLLVGAGWGFESLLALWEKSGAPYQMKMGTTGKKCFLSNFSAQCLSSAASAAANCNADAFEVSQPSCPACGL